MQLLRLAGLLIGTILCVLIGYGVLGFVDGLRSAPQMREQAAEFKASGRGMDVLSPDQLQILLVQDPGFFDHHGIDLKTPGAGITTATQSLSKRVAFEEFKPGYRKLRQSTFALGLERRLTKEEILTLFLNTVPMGRSPEGWTIGFFDASEAFFGKDVPNLTEDEFIRLVAVMIAPGVLTANEDSERLLERVRRIKRLSARDCNPEGLMDVWLEGCAEKASPSARVSSGSAATSMK